jgi:hypothetical protein
MENCLILQADFLCWYEVEIVLSMLIRKDRHGICFIGELILRILLYCRDQTFVAVNWRDDTAKALQSGLAGNVNIIVLQVIFINTV